MWRAPRGSAGGHAPQGVENRGASVRLVDQILVLTAWPHAHTRISLVRRILEFRVAHALLALAAKLLSHVASDWRTATVRRSEAEALACGCQVTRTCERDELLLCEARPLSLQQLHQRQHLGRQLVPLRQLALQVCGTAQQRAVGKA